MRNKKLVFTSALAAAGVAVGASAVGVGLAWGDPAGDGSGASKADCETALLAEDIYSHANDVSPSGDYIAGATYTEEHAESERTPVLWEKGEAVDIADAVAKAFPDYSGATVEAINDDGVAAGNNGQFDGTLPYRYQDGEVTPLNLPDGVTDAWVQGIAADGTVLAVGEDEESGDDVAVAWEGDSDEGAAVEAPEGVQVSDIDDRGELAGFSQVDDETYQVWHTIEDEWIEPEGVTTSSPYMVLSGEFLLAGNLMVDLTIGEGVEHDVDTPQALDANGVVYGIDGDGNPVFDAGDGAEKLPSNDTDDNPAEPQAANDDGSVVVGESSSGFDEHTTTHGVIWNCQV